MPAARLISQYGCTCGRTVMLNLWISRARNRTRNFLAKSMRQLFKARDVERYIQISENWTNSTIPNGNYHPSISSPSNRMERIWIYAEDKKFSRAAELRILRPNSGQPKLTKLRKLSHTRYRIGGRFTGLLREREVSRGHHAGERAVVTYARRNTYRGNRERSERR